MKVTREQVRKKIVGEVHNIVNLYNMRFRAPGLPPIDISVDKSPYVNLDIIYLDGYTVGLGVNTDDRLMGQILVEVNYKEGGTSDLITANNLLDAVQTVLSNSDHMFPVRTYTSKQHSPQFGSVAGWVREGLLTPFWYDR